MLQGTERTHLRPLSYEAASSKAGLWYTVRRRQMCKNKVCSRPREHQHKQMPRRTWRFPLEISPCPFLSKMCSRDLFLFVWEEERKLSPLNTPVNSSLRMYLVSKTHCPHAPCCSCFFFLFRFLFLFQHCDVELAVYWPSCCEDCKKRFLRWQHKMKGRTSMTVWGLGTDFCHYRPTIIWKDTRESFWGFMSLERTTEGWTCEYFVLVGCNNSGCQKWYFKGRNTPSSEPKNGKIEGNIYSLHFWGALEGVFLYCVE